MKVLVINAGSSSLKYQLIDMVTETVLAKGICERIGIKNSFIKHTKTGFDPVTYEKDIPSHRAAMYEVVKVLTDRQIGAISDMLEIAVVGHRVVHGGEKFSGSVVIDDAVMQTVRDCIDMAPLHNPPNITGIEACMEIMPDTPMVGVFDTAFHQSMPPHAYMYALPYEFYEKYGIRKYGFHGTSHKYVVQRAALFLDRPLEELKVISCHLGNGASACAIKGGKSVDTSLGFTPLEGLAMGTRSGSIDPAIIKCLMDKEKMNISEVDTLLNKKSGMLGVSGVSSDFRDIIAAAQSGNERCRLAIEIFCYRVKKYLGAYSAAMGGLDVIIFTAGIGENNGIIRQKCVEGLEYLGVAIDPEKNKLRGGEIDISTSDARVKTVIIPTNEELQIAREALQLIANKPSKAI